MLIQRCEPDGSYTIVCPPLGGDNPRALASGLSPVQWTNHGLIISYDGLTYYKIFHAIVCLFFFSGKLLQSDELMVYNCIENVYSSFLSSSHVVKAKNVI